MVPMIFPVDHEHQAGKLLTLDRQVHSDTPQKSWG